MKVSLVVKMPGSNEDKVIPITRTPYLIGRDGKCHLRPSSAIISNRHCALDVRGGKVYIVDLKSTNGTFVNKEKVQNNRQLVDGDWLQLGPLAFQVRIETNVAIDTPTPLPPLKAPAATTADDDESIAAVLLSMSEDGPASGERPVDSTGVPTGGTEVLTTQTMAALPDETNKDAKGQKADKEKAAAKNTSVVANELLKKYLRRPKKVKD
jgi:pSer/pThr/pTyr-binding forkhead associated (FHA) protein